MALLWMPSRWMPLALTGLQSPQEHGPCLLLQPPLFWSTWSICHSGKKASCCFILLGLCLPSPLLGIAFPMLSIPVSVSFMFLLTWLLLLGDYSWCSSRICPQFLCVLHWTHSLAEKTRWDANAAFWDCMPNGHKCLKLHAQFHKIPNSSLTFLRTHTQFLQMIRGVKDEFHNIHLEVIIQCSMASLKLSLWRNEDRINLIQSSSWQL